MTDPTLSAPVPGTQIGLLPFTAVQTMKDLFAHTVQQTDADGTAHNFIALDWNADGRTDLVSDIADAQSLADRKSLQDKARTQISKQTADGKWSAADDVEWERFLATTLTTLLNTRYGAQSSIVAGADAAQNKVLSQNTEEVLAAAEGRAPRVDAMPGKQLVCRHRSAYMVELLKYCEDVKAEFAHISGVRAQNYEIMTCLIGQGGMGAGHHMVVHSLSGSNAIIDASVTSPEHAYRLPKAGFRTGDLHRGETLAYSSNGDDIWFYGTGFNDTNGRAVYKARQAGDTTAVLRVIYTQPSLGPSDPKDIVRHATTIDIGPQAPILQAAESYNSHLGRVIEQIGSLDILTLLTVREKTGLPENINAALKRYDLLLQDGLLGRAQTDLIEDARILTPLVLAYGKNTAQ